MYQNAPHCRFCTGACYDEVKIAGPPPSPALEDVCADCEGKRDKACVKTLPCGHVCMGVRGENLSDGEIDDAERLPFLTKQLSLADAEARGGDAAAKVRADRLRLRLGTVKKQPGGGAAAQAKARPLKLSMVEADGATLGKGNDPVNCLFDDDDVYSTSKGSNTNLVFGTSLSVVLV
jgi:hypothetical protein